MEKFQAQFFFYCESQYSKGRKLTNRSAIRKIFKQIIFKSIRELLALFSH